MIEKYMHSSVSKLIIVGIHFKLKVDLGSCSSYSSEEGDNLPIHSGGDPIFDM